MQINNIEEAGEVACLPKSKGDEMVINNMEELIYKNFHSNKEAALTYAEKGYKVFPVNYIMPNGKCSCKGKVNISGKEDTDICSIDSPGKHPIGHLAKRGCLSATTRKDVIERWWSREPFANIGLAAENFVALDIDGEKGLENLLKIDINNEIVNSDGTININTPVSKTGRKGYGKHVFFKKPNDIKIENRVNFAPGLDFRSDGGYIVVPPSNHKSGNNYTWERSILDYGLMEMPQWLKDAYKKSEVSEGSEDGNKGTFSSDEKIPDGQRNSILTSLAGKLRRIGLSREEIEVTLLTTNNRCIHPLSEKEVRTIARSISKYEPAYNLIDPNNINPINTFTVNFEDLTRGSDNGSFKFSPTKAAESILRKVPLAVASWEVDKEKANLWTCDSETNIWKKGGGFLVEDLCEIAGDLSKSYVIAEVKRKIINRLRSQPIELDTGKPYLFGTKNGFACNLLTGDVRKIVPEDHISEELMLPVNYDPSAKCPNIFNFYDSICSDDCNKMALIDDDVATLDLRAWRYIILLLGQGGNGKGERMRMKRAFFGAHTFANIPLKDLNDDQFAGAETYRKRVVHCGEAKRSEKGEKYDTSVLKMFSGDDRVTLNQKNEKRLDFAPFCKVSIDSNNPPLFNDNSRGFKDRFRRINNPFYFVDNPDPLDKTQKQKDEDNLSRITTDEEFSGYLNVLLARSIEITKKRKYPRCPHLVEGYEKQTYSIQEFIDQFCEVEENYNNQNYVIVNDLYANFQKWVNLTNSSNANLKKFGKDFRSLTGIGESENKKINGKQYKVYYRITFKEEVYREAIENLEEKLFGPNINDDGDCKALTEKYEELKNRFGKI